MTDAEERAYLMAQIDKLTADNREAKHDLAINRRRKTKIPGVRRGTSKRRAASLGQHMGQFWQMEDADRAILNQISERGRR